MGRRERGQENIHFLCSADQEQDWQPYPIRPYSAICDDHYDFVGDFVGVFCFLLATMSFAGYLLFRSLLSAFPA